jgi:hypothetical protein
MEPERGHDGGELAAREASEQDLAVVGHVDVEAGVGIGVGRAVH